MRVEIVQRPRSPKALHVFRRAIGMEADREQLALDQVRLGRLADTDSDIRLAHRQIELLVGYDQLDPDLRIKRGELAEARDQPVDADALGGGDLEVATRPLAAVGEFGS